MLSYGQKILALMGPVEKIEYQERLRRIRNNRRGSSKWGLHVLAKSGRLTRLGDEIDLILNP